jgi:imidazolonepropionase-like amidohydrolase
MRKNLFFIILLIICKFPAFSQETFHDNGVKDKRPDYYLFKNATLHVDGKTTINEGWVLIKGNKIEKVGKNFDYPKTTQVMDMSGKHIYPGFVDIYSDYGMPAIVKKPGGGYYNTEFKSGKEGAYAWNQALKPEVRADEIFKVDDKSAAELRKIGFGATVTHLNDGIARGNSALVSLNNATENEVLLKSNVSSHFSFDKGSSIQSYPVSLMGSVALLRQAYYDAKWYTNGGIGSERNLSLAALAQNMALTAVFHGKSFLDAQRADKIGKEFGIKYILKSGGDDYKRISEIKELNTHIIAPISFPKALDVEDPIDAEIVSLADLKNWEMAPSNLAILAKNNISFSISTSDLTDKSQFFANIQKAIQFGLDKSIALDALTSSPAKALKIDDLVGSIKNGMLANLLISNEEIFNPKAKILENWIQGNKFVINDLSLSSIKGTYSSNLTGFSKLEITGENEKPSIELFENDTTKVKTTTTRDRNFLTINYKKGNTGLVRLSGYIADKRISGNGKDEDGKAFAWNATLNEDPKVEDKKVDSTKKVSEEKLGEIIYPFTAFGNKEKPSKEDFIIKNTTIWTNEAVGNIQGDVIIKNGKIDAIGKNLSSAGLKVIDGTNKHLTNGIIDEHSHIALFSINEIESVSSEVRQEDVVNSEDVNIYRQLAGGVTTSQLLHGSADCIGGQSAIIKLKWGESADKLIIPNSPKFIKFALGENVKRGNSPQAPNRYPSTRMGVEQVFTDAFTRAIAYKKEWATYSGTKIKTGLTAPRTDLELDALVEILDGKRNITCHSYVQSEINMLMKLSDSLGFKINTFTHILEGYKVADKMKARNISGSTFSDWWAYKMEVKEAIPYNAAIMTKVGVNTAINSDDAEMARRLNQEAAKTMLYGGLSESEAWKMVTLNPAKMLHLDDRLGSIKKGKDADLVLWTDNPLSVYAKPEKTIIDGIVYFDLDKEASKIEDIETEKNRIIQKLLAEKSKGTPTVKPISKPKRDNIHCDAILEYDGVSVEQLDQFLENLNK